MASQHHCTRIVITSLLTLALSWAEVQVPEEEEFNAETWLRQYGYLSQASRQMSTMQSAQILSKAISDMQLFYGLEVTGEMDPATILAMRRPRCGVPDRKPEELDDGARKKRYALTGQQWDKDHITFSAVMAPFYQWVPSHNFTLHEDDIKGIQYIYGGPLMTDAPATTPSLPKDLTTVVSTTTNEEAPSSSNPTSLPPETQPSAGPDVAVQPEPDTTLAPTTTTTHQESVPAPPHPPSPPKKPDQLPPNICDGDFDTVTVLRGEMFVFKGRWFWRVRRNRVLDNYPMPISVFWMGLPNDIDAAYERHDGKFVFFKDDRYWLFREADVLPGYPQPLHTYGRGVPAHGIDMAIWWEPNEYTYFFKGDRYWRYNEETRSTDADFPKPISRWGKIPPSPRGAFLSDDGAYTYFYKGANYWRFNNRRAEADPGYPRSILRDFMGCAGASHPKPDPEVDPVNPTERETDKRDRDSDKEVVNPEIPKEEDDVDKEVNVVVTAADGHSKVMTLIMVTVPLVLILCILVIIYAILRTLQNKETPRALVHCKRSLQQMFNWVVKVVPQPPEPPVVEEPVKAPVKNPPKPKEAPPKKNPPLNADTVSIESQSQSGVLGWFSNGFVNALPQPAGSPRLSRAEGEKGSRVFEWVSQGLNNMLPQPDEKYRESPDLNNEEHTEIFDVQTMPDSEPLPHIPVVEMISDDEDTDNDRSSSLVPKVGQWIKQIIPQPVTPGTVVHEPSSSSTRSSLDKVFRKYGRLVCVGFWMKLPQPALPTKDGADGAAEILKRASSKLQPDMVLEDVESDTECQQKHAHNSNSAIPLTSLIPPSPVSGEPIATPESPPTSTKISQEDAETQTGRWTPFIESIKREAEDVAMATMEERLLHERLEMARMAEEVARQTAEMAIRQMATEGQSTKFSTSSQDLLEEPDVELPVPQDEEDEEEPSTISEKETILVDEKLENAEDHPEPEPIQEVEVEQPPSEAQVESQVVPDLNAETVSETVPGPLPEPQPLNEAQEDTPLNEPVSKQPQKAEENGQANNKEKPADKEEEAEDVCAPVSCESFKNCLMRLPHNSECFGNINAFFKENGISFPKCSSMPKCPTQLSESVSNLLLKALKVQIALASPALHKRFPISHKNCPRFPAAPGSTWVTSVNASVALCHKMPKKQSQQQQKQNSSVHDVELNRLVRSPLTPPHHAHSRSPSPSSLNGSNLELPNVPSYSRLPPIVSSPSKQLMSRQLSGLSNPAFFIEDDSDCPPFRPAESSISLRPAVNVEDVDSDHERAGRKGGVVEEPSAPNLQDPKLTTLTVQ
ncbi:hypothetical protein WMY93_023119 [Mugilogobius chulae]|uniref:Uncharacterized protein n=1 Tax=Mugilogobius chulae TaxID=88201 RepID=A0AAW0N4Y9_9GOBI